MVNRFNGLPGAAASGLGGPRVSLSKKPLKRLTTFDDLGTGLKPGENKTTIWFLRGLELNTA